MILLDTNVLSETMHHRPEPAVLHWIDTQRRDSLWTCAIVFAEVFSGLDLMPPGKREIQLREKVEIMFTEFFEGRIFPFDERTARFYGIILRNRKKINRPIAEMDALIAATAMANNAILATRNISDFADCEIEVVNPWKAA